MDIDTFWELIERTRGGNNSDFQKQTELIKTELLQLSEQELIECEDIFDNLMREAYLPDLWEVAYIINCGCSDDGFMDFRDWLICQGKNIYQKALLDPESLTDTIEISKLIGEEHRFGNRGIWTALCDSWKRKGKEIISIPREPKPRLQLKRKLRDENQMIAAFPKTAAKFWKQCSSTSN